MKSLALTFLLCVAAPGLLFANHIRVGGYMGSRLLSGDSNGYVQLVALPEVYPGSLELYYEGIPTGLRMADDGLSGDGLAEDGLWGIALPIDGRNLPPTDFLLEVRQDEEALWPHMAVKSEPQTCPESGVNWVRTQWKDPDGMPLNASTRKMNITSQGNIWYAGHNFKNDLSYRARPFISQISQDGRPLSFDSKEDWQYVDIIQLLEKTPEYEVLVIDTSRDVFLETSGFGANDIILAKLDDNENVLWVTRFGGASVDLVLRSKVLSNSDFALAGSTWSQEFNDSDSLGRSDAFLVLISNEGTIKWTRLFGGEHSDTTYGTSQGIEGNLYVCGKTQSSEFLGDTNSGVRDAFITKWDINSTLIWSKLIGGDGVDVGYDVVSDYEGNLYLAGITSSQSFYGHRSIGEGDFFLVKFSSSGDFLWTKRWGTDESEGGGNLVLTPKGNIVVVGLSSSKQFYSYSTSSDLSVVWTLMSPNGEIISTHGWGGEPDMTITSVSNTLDSNANVLGFITQDLHPRYSPFLLSICLDE